MTRPTDVDSLQREYEEAGWLRSHGWTVGEPVDRSRRMRECPGAGCLTMIPADRTRCHFCRRSVRLRRSAA